MALFECSKISLKKGSRGENVKTLQTQLKTLGYYSRQVDGDFGYYTDLAVKAFQRANSLSADGWFAVQTCTKLTQVIESKNVANGTTATQATSATTKTTTSTDTEVLSFDCPKTSLKYGAQGEQVKTLQTMLKALGYYDRQIDGDFGVYTQRGVKDFQKKTNHDPDGWFGPKTCPDLNYYYQQKVGAIAAATKDSSTSATTEYTTPDYLKTVDIKLTCLPEVIVLPDVEKDPNTAAKVVNIGGTNTEGNFNCETINLKEGSTGDDVKQLQTILKARGYYTRQIDGEFGKYTAAAVKSLQGALGGLLQDGWFGPSTCRKLQGTNATSSTATGTAGGKNKEYVIKDFYSFSSNDDAEGLSHEVTIQTPYSEDKLAHIRRYQKTQLDIYFGDDRIYGHDGYISDIKVIHSDDAFLIEFALVGYTAFLDVQIEYERTAKQSEIIKELIEKAGLKADIDLTGLPDEEITVKAVSETETGGTGGGGLTQLSGNDCTGHMQTNQLSAWSFDINQCGGNTKIGNSTANYAVDTRNMSAKEAILDVYNRFKYGKPGNSSVYDDNERCPQLMWNTDGRIYGNCADISRLIKCVGEVHGLKVGIRHCPSHYYNLIEVNGKTYRFDCCFKGGVTGSKYGSEVCNTLTKNGGPWQ